MKSLIFIALLFSCSEKKTPTKPITQTVKKSCLSSFERGDISLSTTGYKYEEKTGVKGMFKSLKVNAPREFESVEELLTNTSFSFDESSLDFGNAARNKNILNGLFKNIAGEVISGKVKSVNNQTQSVTMDLNWGEKSHEVILKYSEVDGSLKLTGEIDIIQLGFGEAFKSFQAICKTMHTKNGTSKSWSTVDILAQVDIKKCQK